jgi:tyrosyl-tRNA synthetase
MNGMVPGLAGGKMSASDPNSKIDILDGPAIVKKKIKEAFAAPGEVEGNGLLAFIKAVLLPIAALQDRSPFVTADAPTGTVFSVNRPEKHGGPMHYRDYAALEADYVAQTMHPADLKLGVTDAIITLLAPIQEEFTTDPTYQETEKLAYPPPPEPEKKKKVKKVNPRFAVPQQQSGTEVPEPPTDGLEAASLDDGVPGKAA